MSLLCTNKLPNSMSLNAHTVFVWPCCSDKLEKKRAIKYSVLHPLGYIPGVGTVVGLYRIFCDAPSEIDKGIRRGTYLRGSIEVLGIGFVLIPIDLINFCVFRKKTFTDYQDDLLIDDNEVDYSRLFQ